MSLRSTHRILACSSVLAAVAPSAVGQQPQPVGTSDFLPWPSTLPGGDFRRAVLGRFTGDLTTQVLVLREDGAAVPPPAVPVLVFDPLGFTDAFFELPASTSWTDVACLPAGGSDGRDALVYTDTSGLWAVEYDGAGGLAHVKTLAGAAWADARQLVVVDVDGDGDLDVAGLDAGGRTVRTVLDVGSQPASGPTFSLAVDVTAFAFGDFDPIPETVEVCVLIPNRVRFYDVVSQSMLAAWPAAVGGGYVTRMRRADVQVGDVAAIAADLSGSGAWQLFAADVSGLELGTDLFLGPTAGAPTTWVEPSSLSTVAWGEDGEAVALRVLDFSVAYAFPGTWDSGTRSHFGDYEVWNLRDDPALPAPNDRAVPAVGPLIDGAQPTCVFPLDAADGLRLVPEVGPTEVLSLDESFFSDAEFAADANGPEGTMRVHAQLPDASEFDHLQVVVWEQENPLQGHLLEQQALSNLVFPVDTSQSSQWIFQVPLPENDVYWPSRRHFYLVARLVAADAGVDPSEGDPVTITAAGREFRAGTTVRPTDDDPGYQAYLISWPHVIEVENVYGAESPGAPSPIGAYVTMGRIPGFEDLPPMAPPPAFDPDSSPGS